MEIQKLSYKNIIDRIVEEASWYHPWGKKLYVYVMAVRKFSTT